MAGRNKDPQWLGISGVEIGLEIPEGQLHVFKSSELALFNNSRFTDKKNTHAMFPLKVYTFKCCIEIQGGQSEIRLGYQLNYPAAQLLSQLANTARPSLISDDSRLLRVTPCNRGPPNKPLSMY